MHAYSLILDNNLTEAEGIIKKANRFSSDYYPLVATNGLLNYRKRNIERGRELYKTVLSQFKYLNDYDSFFYATLCFAREENLLGNNPNDILKPLLSSRFDALVEQNKTLIKNYGFEGILSR